MRFWLGAIVCLGLAACGGATVEPRDTPAVLASSGGSGLNAIRANANLAPVRRNATLDAAARAHASDMARRGFFSHHGSNGSTVGKRVTRAGYRWCSVAENIAKGFSSRQAVVEQWRVSPGHYKNMTKRKVQEYGLAQVDDVWVMVLAAKSC